jgi:hypothetical protein
VDQQFWRSTDLVIAELQTEGFAGEPEVAYAINMRCFGQNYEHEMRVPYRRLTAEVLAEAFASFEQIHRSMYGMET